MIPSIKKTHKILLSKILSVSIAIILISSIAIPIFGYAKPVSAQVPSFGDTFTQDNSLNTNLWEVNGPVGNYVFTHIGSPPASIVVPTISFQNGLAMSGVSGTYQAASIQSMQSFSAPFTLTTTVEGTVANGVPFVLGISNQAGTETGYIAGNVNSGNGGYYGIWWGSGTSLGTQQIVSNPSTNVLYTLTISVDSTGSGTFTVSSNGNQLGQVTKQVGTGSFYILLGQFEGLPYTVGPNNAIWQSVQLSSSSGGSTSPVTFTESGLPSGTSWSVTLNGNTQSTTSTSLTFNEPNGNYQFTVNPPASYNVVPYSQSLTVNGSPISQALTFVPPVQESGSNPVSMSLTGTVSGPITNLQMTLTSGTITAAGTTYSITGSPGQYCNQNNVVCNSPNGVLSAGNIQLPNGLVLGLASCYTQMSNNQLQLSFYNGHPNTCGGTTAIVQPPSNAFYCPFNATGTLTVSGSQAIITASGTGNCNIPITVSTPGAPTGLTATAVSNSKINLSWTAPTNTGGAPVTGYEIQKSIFGGPLFVLVANTGSPSTTYSDTGLDSGTRYGYVISAINSAGVGQPSTEASSTTNSGCVTGSATNRNAILPFNYGSANTNLFNVNSGSTGGASMCYDSSNGLQTSILFSNINYGGTPAGYPNIGYGYNLYDQKIGSMGSLQFPMTVQQFSNLGYTSSITYSLETSTPNNLPTDFVYDLWIEKNISSSGPQNGDVEVMIDPYDTYANSQWTQNGTFQETATVNGNQETLTWNILKGPGGTSATVVAFELPRSEQISSGSIALKLQDFIQYAGNVVNKPLSNYNLMGIEVGSEFGANPGFLQSSAAAWKWNISQFILSNSSSTINIISSNGVSSSGPTGNNINFESSLIKAFDNTYNFTLQITPTLNTPGGSFIALNADEANSLVHTVLNQLQQQGLLTSTSVYYISVSPSDVIDQKAVDLANVVTSLPTLADSTSTFVGSFGNVPGYAITTAGMINDLTNIFPTIPNPPTIVTDIINNMFTGISQNTEKSLLSTVPICGQNNEQFSPQYIAGPGQEIEIVVTGLSKQIGNTMSVTAQGNNEIIQPATPLPSLQETSCSFNVGIQGYDGSFQAPINLNIGLWGADYWSGTITTQDPQTQFININAQNLQIENAVFNSTASTISSSVNIEGNTLGILNYTIPISLDPTNSSSFVITLNGNQIPYQLTYKSDLGYLLNSVVNTNGELVLHLPTSNPVIALSENYRSLVVSGSGFGSEVQLQFYNGMSWLNFTNSSIRTSQGNFIYQTEFPKVSTNYLLVKAADNEGKITTSAIKSPTTPIVFATPDRTPDNNSWWYNKPVTISFSGFSSSTQPLSCNSPITYAGPDGIEIIVTGSCSNSYGVGTGNVTINYDSMPPEAYLEFNSTTKDVTLYGNDSLSGIPSNPIAPASVVPAKVDNDNNKHNGDSSKKADRNGADNNNNDEHGKNNAELRTYDIADRAGNTLKLVEKVRVHGDEAKVHIISLQYNNGSVISVGKNEEKFEWSANKTGSINELEQHITVGKDGKRQDIDAKYSSKDNTTVIEVKNQSEHTTKITEPGLVLLHTATNQGNLLVNGY